jgi:hypothetical protein
MLAVGASWLCAAMRGHKHTDRICLRTAYQSQLLPVLLTALRCLAFLTWNLKVMTARRRRGASGMSAPLVLKALAKELSEDPRVHSSSGRAAGAWGRQGASERGAAAPRGGLSRLEQWRAGMPLSPLQS